MVGEPLLPCSWLLNILCKQGFAPHHQKQSCFCHHSAHLIFSHGTSTMLPKKPGSVPAASTTQPHLGSHFWCPSGASFCDCVFEGIPPLFVSRNHPVLSLWPVNNSFVVCRRMTWKESISWPLLKKMIQVGGYFPPHVTPTTPTTSKKV